MLDEERGRDWGFLGFGIFAEKVARGKLIGEQCVDDHLRKDNCWKWMVLSVNKNFKVQA